MKSWIVTPIVVVLIAIGSYAFYILTLPPVLDEGFLYGNGHIEGTEVNISAEVSGRVLHSNLMEGSTIEKDSVLVELDARGQVASLAIANAEMTALEYGQKHVAEQLQTWKDNLNTAVRDLVRYKALRKRKIVTVQKLDQVAQVRTDALGRVRALEVQLEKAKASTAVAARQVERLQIEIDKAKIYSPMNATVLSKAIELGELAGQGQLIAVLVDMQDLELKAYLPEKLIGKVKLDAPAKVRVSAFPDRYFEARVKRVDQYAQFTPRDINMPEERVRMVFGVVLELNNKEGFLKPGMPADAWIRWDDNVVWPIVMVIPH